MSDLLGIGASGISAYRTALSTIGENVVNSENKGYSRRDVRIDETVTALAGNPLYKKDSSGGGVTATLVVKAWDDYRARDSRVTAAEAGRTDARVRWLTVTENALDDSAVGAGAKLSNFFASASALAADPNGAAPRRAMLLALDDAASGIRTTSAALARAANGISNEAQGTVDVINSDLRALSQVNLAIARAVRGSSASANLSDERNRLIDSLSEKIGIEVELDGDGAATITLEGSSSTKLVDGTRVGTFALTTRPDGQLSLSLSAAGANLEVRPTSGALAGLVEAATSVSEQRASLDAIAVDFRTKLNAWSEGGTTAGGAPGGALLTATGAADIRAIAIDPADIPSADDSSANGNLLALQSLRTDGAEARLGTLVNTQAQALASAKAEDAAASTRRDAALVARDEQVGVDLDREAAELIRFQQAYEGSARIIQVARETLQSVLDLF